MTFPPVRKLVAGAVVACASVVACSGPPPASRAYVAAQLGNTGTAGACTVSLQQILIIGGGVQGQLPTLASDGAIQGGQKVHVSCTVTPGSGGYNLQLSTIQDGTGSMTVTGTVDSTGNGTGLTGIFVYLGTDFRDTGCTVTPTYYGQPPPISGSPVAGGRIFAHIACPNAAAQGQAQTCNASADFEFEDCGGS